MPRFPLLQELPTELRQDILERLCRADLRALNRASKWAYQQATPLLWREVELMDCTTYYEDGNDDHDDLPLIRKLLLFANNPWIASCVQELTHRCHLPPPAIFRELPFMNFNCQTLSTDARTIKLVQLAAKNLKNVHTLRIIAGHPSLTDAILRCFFDAARHGISADFVRIRRLWLENCRISIGLNMQIDEHPYGLPLACNFEALEVVRFRRLPMKPGTPYSDIVPRFHYAYSRGGIPIEMNDGLGGTFSTSMSELETEVRAGEEQVIWLEDQRNRPSAHDRSPLEKFYEVAHTFDDSTYERLESLDFPSEVLELSSMTRPERATLAYRGSWLDPGAQIPISNKPFYFPFDLNKSKLLMRTKSWKRMQREKISSADAVMLLLNNASATLTSLNIDWALTIPSILGHSREHEAFESWTSIFLALFRCRFPHLRSFQFRNCVVPETRLPKGLYLLDHSSPYHGDPSNGSVARMSKEDESAAAMDLAGLEFMEAHPNLKCLAWPMDHFFGPSEISADITDRVDKVVANLGRTLLDLRVDTLYAGPGSDEAQTEEVVCSDPATRASRRQFITRFANKMTRLESIKIEGGMPRDERREVVRALHACPLQKIVMIGTSCPVGNTWGENGQYIGQIVEENELVNLEGEDETAAYRYGGQDPESPGPETEFSPRWEWKGSPPMLYTLASCHASTIKELKFCGYKGSPVLFTPTAITAPLLGPLKHFHNLESIIMSLWLTTLFENGTDARDTEIIQYWCNVRSPASAALVVINDEEPEEGSWERELRTKYAPDALAWRITNFLGPYLSEKAKARKGGVHVRASFCVGDMGGIFDMDLIVGKGSVGSDVCKTFKGPREELEEDRRVAKLKGRRWF
ncbi:Hypothetical predicted protein [Lecanosticta acicola]|uniref:F-box domain-containing protein n=1 Tax=Lecanosticta acicola TaxID=111012 RepID=A0AAI8W252_9PEZI|nr:Hypothetical predicted protein [Lecanosticta acicola]